MWPAAGVMMGVWVGHGHVASTFAAYLSHTAACCTSASSSFLAAQLAGASISFELQYLLSTFRTSLAVDCAGDTQC